MGLFDFIEEAVDAAVSLPGKTLEVTAETVVRLPELPIKAVQGIVKGVEKGIEKVEDALD